MMDELAPMVRPTIVSARYMRRRGRGWHAPSCLPAVQWLALFVQQRLYHDLYRGDRFVFRDRRRSLIKIIWYDDLGMSLYAKRRFIWPVANDGVVPLTALLLPAYSTGSTGVIPQYSPGLVRAG